MELTQIQFYIGVSSIIVSIAVFIVRLEGAVKRQRDNLKHFADMNNMQNDNQSKVFEEKLKAFYEIFKEAIAGIKDDILRLERKQEESNKVKERVAIIERSDARQWEFIDKNKGADK